MCKKTGSYILIAVLLLTILTACGGKTPKGPVETNLYHALITGNTEPDALRTVVFLGYYESADAMKAELPEALKNLPLAEMGGGEAYAVIPRYEGELVTLYSIEMDENANAICSETGTRYDGAVLVMCNHSDIFSNVQIELKMGEEAAVFSPYISLKDGSVVTHNRVPVSSID